MQLLPEYDADDEDQDDDNGGGDDTLLVHPTTSCQRYLRSRLRWKVALEQELHAKKRRILAGNED